MSGINAKGLIVAILLSIPIDIFVLWVGLQVFFKFGLDGLLVLFTILSVVLFLILSYCRWRDRRI